MLGFVAENVLAGLVEIAEWNEPDTDKETIILDVREPGELAMYSYENSINIPLGQLRGRLDELDKNKKYIVVCAIGVRAYNAARILKNNGFENVKVYPAGTRMYMSTHRNPDEFSQEFVCKY